MATTKRKSIINSASLLDAFASVVIVFPLLQATLTGDLNTLMLAVRSLLEHLSPHLLAKEIEQLRDNAKGAGSSIPPEWFTDIQLALTTINRLLPAPGEQPLTAMQLAELIEAQREQPAMADALQTLIIRFHLEEVLTRQQQSDEHHALLAAVEVHAGLTESDRTWLQGLFAKMYADLANGTISNPPPPPRDDDAALLEAAYARKLMAKCNVVPLGVINPRETTAQINDTKKRSLELTSLYVALNTTASEKDEVLDDLRSVARVESLSALQAMDRTRRMVLLGAPGAGKSTFVNYMAACLAGARLPDVESGNEWLARLQPEWTHPALLPIRIILRAFAASSHCDGTANGVWQYLKAELVNDFGEDGAGDCAGILYHCLLRGGALVIFDGLDEVDDAKRMQARNAVQEFAGSFSHPGNRFLVTCRIYAYAARECKLADFNDYTLAAFTDEQIDQFITLWYKNICALGWKSTSEAETLTTKLQQAISTRADLAKLADNPLQLAMLTSLHYSWGRLPDDRAHLYQQMVDLLLVRWQEHHLGAGSGISSLISPQSLLSTLEAVAYTAHDGQGEKEGVADIAEFTLINAFAKYTANDLNRARDVVHYLRDRAGLLLEQQTGVFTFPHRSYQEYLAGSYLAKQQNFPYKVAQLTYARYDHWREAVLWSVEIMARLKGLSYIVISVVTSLCPHEAPVEDATISTEDIAWRQAMLAAEALLTLSDNDETRQEETTRDITDRVRVWLVALLTRQALPVRERAVAGDLLARLGDNRPGVGIVPTTGLPDICWLPIPPGAFTMGEDEEAHTVKLDYAYQMSKYPITVVQFRAFILASGYTDERWWTREGWRWCVRKEITGPGDYGSPFDIATHPVVGVNWYEAQAFTKWLTHVYHACGVLDAASWIALPSEAEWERGARGKDERIYPWGNEWDANLANNSDTDIGATCVVGCFPGGCSPYGIEEMSGNVWEWTRSMYQPYPYNPDDGREASEGNEARVLRGGCWSHRDPEVFRAAYRNLDGSTLRNGSLGFRCVIRSPGP